MCVYVLVLYRIQRKHVRKLMKVGRDYQMLMEQKVDNLTNQTDLLYRVSFLIFTRVYNLYSLVLNLIQQFSI